LITGLAFDRTGNLYYSDLYNHLINRVDTAGTLTVVGGRLRFAGDGGSAYHAVAAFLTRIAADSNGSVYIGDAWNRRIRKIDSSLNISTFAGNGNFGDYVDGLPAEAASLGWTNQMLSLPDGSLLVADYGSNRVRRIDSLGMITTISGTGRPGSGGDGGPAVNAQLNNPFGVGVDSAGNIYVSEVTGNRVRKITVDGKDQCSCRHGRRRVRGRCWPGSRCPDQWASQSGSRCGRQSVHRGFQQLPDTPGRA
jgi:sugar lactone lactonase YvrE